MKFTFFILIVILFFTQHLFSQSVPGPAEKIETDTICNCLSTIDLSKISNKKEAIAAFTECFAKRMDLLMKVAEERHVEVTNGEAMRQVGIDIAKNLLNQNCAAFAKISAKMAANETEADNQGRSEGKLKRIELKGFNYIIITNDNNNEESFIWLKQFPGSEKFMKGIAQFVGKKVKITWDEQEVYLPQANGYYKIKEITAIDIL